MFPEYRELITHLKSVNPRFLSLFNKHHQLDSEIMRREGKKGNGFDLNIALLKKEKLRLKDALYQMLKHASQQTA
ncbi:DUF465 domain-containing protein [Citrobacter sp. JGM124]|uniref:DUF465 domain-containing protein n=1 Tax=Citrobacter sp. JGM124 TaxID=2799789 RepID=UPI001BA499DC|nr:DUF465 domain-containing protein [Citrobacter sp. JGM124]MBS0847372.1 DUF465 domain-containing protein [Citrobacter sp. JGM124]